MSNRVINILVPIISIIIGFNCRGYRYGSQWL